MSRSLWAAGLSVAAAAALSACVSTDAGSFADPQTSSIPPAEAIPTLNATITRFPDDGFHYLNAQNTVRAGLRGIARRYIDPVEMDSLALDGIRGLVTIEPGISLEQADSVIRLRLNQDIVADFPRPLGNDPEDWAELTTSIIRAGRNHSAELHEADNERVYKALFDGMLAGLDTFSRYYGVEEARANRARRDGFGGIGIRFTKADYGVLVTRVQKDSPALEVGLRTGDVITNVNGNSIATLSLRQVANRLRGPVGSDMTLSISRLDMDATKPDRQISFSLNRALIVPETVRASVQDDILNLRVTGFNKNTSSSMHETLTEQAADFKSGKIKGVVIDLRGNPGGSLSQSVNVADLFLDHGRIIATRGRHPDSFHDYRAGGIDLLDGMPLVILVDGDSASAAEIVASALQDLGRAVVIGSASYGKGTVQTVIRMPNDGEMTLTWSRLVSPSGYALHGLGVMPAVCATNAADNDFNAILAPAHIDSQRDSMQAWRAAGLIFDGRRSGLRDACPAKAFAPNDTNDLLMRLAGRVIHDQALYQRAIELSEPINTALRN